MENPKTRDRCDLSVVVPVYGAPQSLKELVRRLAAALAAASIRWEAVLVEDHCPLGSWEVLRRLTTHEPHILAIRLARNFGQHAAIHAGLCHSKGDWVAVMDCDLQDRPEEIPKLLEFARSAGHDVVVGRRVSRQDSIGRRAASLLFYAVFSQLTGTRQNAEIGNFGVYHRRVIDSLIALGDSRRYLPALVQWVGFDRASLPVVHDRRSEGRSSYSFAKIAKLAVSTIVNFSSRPLTMIALFGFAMTSISFVIACFYTLVAAAGLIAVQGWAALMVSLWFLSGLIILMIGVCGLYIGRVHTQTLQRPVFVVKEILRSG